VTLDEDNAPAYEVPVAPIAAPRPIVDPLALKERTVRDYTRNAGRPGMPSSAAAIEALAVADLNLSDAYLRDTPKPMAPSPAAQAEAKREQRAKADALAKEQHGVDVTRGPVRDLGPQLDLPPEYGLSERWQHAKGRLLMIMTGASPPVRFADGTFDFRSMTSTCLAPDLAYRFLAHWFDFDLRGLPQTAKHNPYYGMSHRDASLKLARLVEDLCDESTKIPAFGNWWAR
jgi:hypothetical protein